MGLSFITTATTWVLLVASCCVTGSYSVEEQHEQRQLRQLQDLFGLDNVQRETMAVSSDICSQYDRRSSNLCRDFCVKEDCVNSPSRKCARIRRRFVRISGDISLPCERCPCWDVDELDIVTAENALAFTCEAIPHEGVLSVAKDPALDEPGVGGAFFVDRTGIIFGTVDPTATPPMCVVRYPFPTFPLVLSLTDEQADICADQVATRCEELGRPI